MPVVPETSVMPEMPVPPAIPVMPAMRVMPAIDEPQEKGIRAVAAVSILVLEDEEHIRTMLVEALSAAGHRVESAADGLKGLALFQGGAFDVVLTDLSLPECSGLDVARSVKRMRPETPVVLITGWGHLLDPERLRDSGVDLMMVKPFRLERVLAVVGDALRLRPIV
jgi:DNA-binding response OmpR family regulator